MFSLRLAEHTHCIDTLNIKKSYLHPMWGLWVHYQSNLWNYHKACTEVQWGSQKQRMFPQCQPTAPSARKLCFLAPCNLISTGYFSHFLVSVVRSRASCTLSNSEVHGTYKNLFHIIYTNKQKKQHNNLRQSFSSDYNFILFTIQTCINLGPNLATRSSKKMLNAAIEL